MEPLNNGHVLGWIVIERLSSFGGKHVYYRLVHQKVSFIKRFSLYTGVGFTIYDMHVVSRGSSFVNEFWEGEFYSEFCSVLPPCVAVLGGFTGTCNTYIHVYTCVFDNYIHVHVQHVHHLCSLGVAYGDL